MTDVVTEDGARVVLRPWTIEDVAALYDLASEPDVAENAGFPVHTDVEASRHVIQTILSAPECYAVVLRDSQTVIGCLQVFANGGRSVYEADAVEIGYWLGKSYWGRNLMSEAVGLLCRRCSQSGQFNCSKIVGKVKRGNVASRRVLEKKRFAIIKDAQWCEYILPV